jgi:glutamate--cysteine ligase
MAGRLAGTEAGVATVGDFADHLTTIFTDVRLKRFLEMRGSDAGCLDMMVAQSALWVGLLYDAAALTAAEALVAERPWTDFAALRPLVARRGLYVPWGSGTLRDLAREMVAIASDGLRSRARPDQAGADESTYLAPLQSIVAGSPTQAEHWLSRFQQAWRGDARQIFREAAI